MTKTASHNVHIAKVSNFTTSLFDPLKLEGVPFKRLMKNLTIKKFDITDPEKYVPMTLMYDYMAKVAHYMDRPNFIATLCKGFKVEDLGDYGTSILANPNMLQLLQEGIKYQEVITTNLRMGLEILGERSRFSFVFIDPPKDGRVYALIINLLQTFAVFRVFGGPHWRPLELQLPNRLIKGIEHALPKGNYPIRHGSLDYGIIFPTEMLSRRNPALAPTSEKPDLSIPSEQLSHRIELLLDNYKPYEMASMTDFADHFNMSVRTIRRRLFIEETTFSEIRERHIFLKAIHLLTTSKMEVAEIAEYLGYNESGNFIRFFKKRTGIPPEKYREKIH